MSMEGKSMEMKEVFGVLKPLICMVHLPPLPGSPRYRGEPVETSYSRALIDAKAASKGGCNGLLVENYNDNPYLKEDRSPSTTAIVAVAARLVMDETGLPVGVSILRNSHLEALGAALAAGAKFIRVNVYTEAYVTTEGSIGAVAGKLLRYRRTIGADGIAVYADVHVKHASPIWERSTGRSALDAIERGLADAVIVTGERTGRPPTRRLLCEVKATIGDKPLIVGSGLTADNAGELMKCADAAIAGTYIKVGGLIANPVDEERVRRLIQEIERFREDG